MSLPISPTRCLRVAHWWAKDFLLKALAVVWLTTAVASAAEPGRLPRVGVLWFVDAAGAEPFEKGLREGLRQLGYVESRNVEIITRYADGNAERLPTLIAEQVGMGVDVLFVSSRALNAAKEGAKKLPIVSAGFSDPVAEGFATSLARPGGNFTGLSWSTAQTTVKRLELAREVIPSLRTIGMLYDQSDPQTLIELERSRAAASSLGLELRAFELQPGAKDRVFLDAILKDRPQALFVSDFPLAVQHREQISRFAIVNRIPLFAEGSVFAESGALLAFGADGVDMFRRAAAYIDKILKGARAGDLPIEQPTKFVLILNLKTAAAIDARIPEVVRFRADKVLQ
jgi:putative ABC transport system substrate-binding protein